MVSRLARDLKTTLCGQPVSSVAQPLHLKFLLILMRVFSAGSEYVTVESVRVSSRMRNNERSMTDSAGLYKSEA